MLPIRRCAGAAATRWRRECGPGAAILMRRIAGFVLAAIVLGADQGSKFYVLHGLRLQNLGIVPLLPVLNFVLVFNRGITFGMLTGFGAAGKIGLAAVAIFVIAALVVWLWRTRKWLTTLAIGGIAGGAIGNVADRLRFGAVVDFIQVHVGWLYFPYIFNVGDSAIVCGVAALMAESLLRPATGGDRKAP
jgi:lipoprotein signal peptidase